MKIAFLWACAVACLGGCDLPGQDAAEDGRGLQVELEGVTMRQYRGDRLRFEFRAEQLSLEEEGQRLQARRRVRGKLTPQMWRRVVK